jgi:6-phosphogluconolactonase
LAATLKIFPDFDSLSAALADRIVKALGEAIAARGQASLIVPGGSTPAAFFGVLSRRVLAWDKVTISMTDERWVPPDSDRSNEHLLRKRLLVGRAAAARFVALKIDEPTACLAQVAVSEQVGAIARPFDLILAGMGDDGHTASLIPGSEELEEALDPENPYFAWNITPPRETGLDERITLTSRALLDARAIALLMRGASKRRTLEKAQSGDDVSEMPVRVLLNQDKVPVEIFWSKD